MKKAAPYLILASGVLWGTTGLFVRQFNDKGISSLDIVAIRAMVTVLCMFVFLLCTHRELLKVRLKDLWCFAGNGILSMLFFNLCYFKSMTLTSLSVAAVLLYTAPAIVMLLSRIFFKEKLTKVKLLSVVFTFVGCVLVTGVIGSGTVLSGAGILVGLGSGLGYALYSIFCRFALERGYHSFTIIFYTFVFTMFGTIPLVNLSDIGNVVFSGWQMIGFTLLCGLVTTVLPYIFYNFGLKYVENGKAAVIASVEPAVATLTGVLAFQERLTITGAIGLLLVIGAIVMCQRKG